MTKRHHRTGVRQLLLVSGALAAAGIVAASVLPGAANAQGCINVGVAPNITAFTCTGNDTDGHAIGQFATVAGFAFPSVAGNPNQLDIRSSMATGATITNAVGSPALSVAMTNGADWTFTALDLMNTITSTNANGIRFGVRAAGSVVTIDYAGQITTINSNAVYGSTQFLGSGGGKFDVEFLSTAIVSSTGGTSDVLGVPTSGGGVVFVNGGSGAVDWDVTNHGTFRTTNDGIFLVNVGGTGTHDIVNDGFLGEDTEGADRPFGPGQNTVDVNITGRANTRCGRHGASP